MNNKLVEAVKLLTVNIATEKAALAVSERRFEEEAKHIEMDRENFELFLIEKEGFIAGYSAAIEAIKSILSPEESASLLRPASRKHRFYYSAHQASLDPEHIVAVITPEGEKIIYTEWCNYPNTKCEWPDAVLVYATDDAPKISLILDNPHKEEQ